MPEVFSETATSPVAVPGLKPHRARHWLGGLLIAYWVYGLAVLLAQASVWIELASHFVWHGFGVGVGLGLLCLLARRPRAALLVAVPWFYFLILFQPWSLWLGAPKTESSSSHRLTVMSWNVLCINQNLDELRTVIAENPVDILILIEVRPNLFEQIPMLEEMYRRRLAFPSWGGNGIAMLTNRDDIEFSRVDFGGKIMPSVVASVGGSLKVIGMHTWSPVPPRRAASRDVQLSELSQWVQQQPEPVCVVGDLNITPWAPAFQKLLSSGLVDSRCDGFGNSASWPAWAGPLGIPIDHALSHGACTIVQRQLGPVVRGSDHRPVIVEIAY